MKDLKLFVWEGVLKDYTSGVMFALAHDIEEARKMLRKRDGYIPEKDLGQKPKVYKKPFALAVWGGG